MFTNTVTSIWSLFHIALAIIDNSPWNKYSLLIFRRNFNLELIRGSNDSDDAYSGVTNIIVNITGMVI